LRTFETVAVETPAAIATSRMVTAIAYEKIVFLKGIAIVSHRTPAPTHDCGGV